jgi:hypothetical protein
MEQSCIHIAINCIIEPDFVSKLEETNVDNLLKLKINEQSTTINNRIYLFYTDSETICYTSSVKNSFIYNNF